MKKSLLILAVLSSAAILWMMGPWGAKGRTDGSPIDLAALRAHTTYLASDELGGRGPGTPGYALAATYVERELERFGVEPLFRDENGRPSYRQPFLLHDIKLKGTPRLKLSHPSGETAWRHHQDFALFWIERSLPSETWPVVYGGYGIEEESLGRHDLEGLALEDHCLAIHAGNPPDFDAWPADLKKAYATPDDGNRRKIVAAKKRGAFCIVALPPIDTSAEWTRNIVRSADRRYAKLDSSNDPLRSDLVALGLDREAARRLFASQDFNPFEEASAPVDPPTFTLNDIRLTLYAPAEKTVTETANIGGLVRGQDDNLDEEYVTIGAHLDGLGTVNGQIFNGANDNAVSCAALLEIARVHALNPTRRPAAFLFYSAEELGLFGSLRFVDSPPMPLDQVIVNINFEMLGGGQFGGFLINGTTSISRDLKPVLMEANRRGPGSNLDFRRDRRNGGGWISQRSDHYNFHSKGVPIIYVAGGGSRHYHKVSDDARFVDYAQASSAAWLSQEMAQLFGNRDRRPAHDLAP